MKTNKNTTILKELDKLMDLYKSCYTTDQEFDDIYLKIKENLQAGEHIFKNLILIPEKINRQFEINVLECFTKERQDTYLNAVFMPEDIRRMIQNIKDDFFILCGTDFDKRIKETNEITKREQAENEKLQSRIKELEEKEKQSTSLLVQCLIENPNDEKIYIKINLDLIIKIKLLNNIELSTKDREYIMSKM